MGYNVLHYTLELGEQFVGRRYDPLFSKIRVDQIFQNREKVEDIIPQLPGELIIKEFPTGRATISTIESHIRKVEDLGIKADLIIIDAVGSCGCTVADKPKEPIKPGSSAPIKVSFDSTGKSGQQSKTVTLTTNTELGKENFTIKGNILPKESSLISILCKS